MSVNKLASLQNVLIKSVLGHPWQEITSMLGSFGDITLEKACIASSMGVYVFKKETLLDLLKRCYPTANDFGSEIIPAAVKELNVQTYLFDDYWEDIGTLKAFYEANLATLLAAAKVPSGIGQNSKITKCIIDKNARIGKNVIIKNRDGVQEADKPSEGYYTAQALSS